ncbi:hypothetical protein BDQ17DRAFT_1370068 [Cyathus striatus]|nr:hypothetical protein BDQ17DRAFT_1370068 [Cyathus striatus]
MFSSSAMSSSTSVESYSTKTYSESTFRSQSMQMSIRTTCKNLVLEGSILWADCLLIDGVTLQRSSIDLDQYIGFVNGALVFGATGFSRHQSLRNIRLEGFILIAECLTEGLGERWIEVRLDLGESFKNKNGALIAITMNADLSVMLSEIPWMKFKVIAEPDLSVFARHPVMKETMTRIAESTVEHVTLQMSSMIQAAITSAVSVVTASAMRHISESMEVMVQDIVGHGHAHGSATASGELRLSGAIGAELKGGAYIGAGGAAAGGGYAYGGGSAVGGGYAYGGGSAVGGGIAYGGGAYSAGSSEVQLTGGAILTGSSGTLSSASESHEEYFATNSVKAGGKIVSPGRSNFVVETST